MKKLTTAFVLFALLLTTSVAFADLVQDAPVLTQDQKEIRVVFQIRGQINGAFQTIVKTFTTVWGLVWQNPDGLTPQQVFDAISKSKAPGAKPSDASQLCLISTAASNFVNTIKTGTLSTDTPKPLTISETGTVTVGE